MLKKLFTAVTVSVVFLSAGVTAFSRPTGGTILRFEIDTTTFTSDGEPRQMDVAPFIDTAYNRAMLPLRTIAEELGMRVNWTDSTRTIVIERGGATVLLSVDTPLPDGMGMPRIVNDRTMVPIRYIAETLEVPVEWDEVNNVSIITVPQDIIATPAIAPQQRVSLEQAEFERRVFELTNIERVNHGVPPLIWDYGLADAARDHSDDMARHNYISHTGSDGSDVGERLDRAGISHRGWSENLTGGTTTPEITVAGLMGSPGHRANILNPETTHLGVGLNHTPDSFYRFHVTQKFAILMPQPSDLVPDVFERRVFELTNIERVNHGVPPLRWHPGLAVAARAHSDDLARNNLNSGIGSDGSRPAERIGRAGVTHAGYVAEIVITGRTTPEATIAVWMNSPEHRAVILHRDLIYVGVGFCYLENSRSQFYTTQKFIGRNQLDTR